MDQRAERNHAGAVSKPAQRDGKIQASGGGARVVIQPGKNNVFSTSWFFAGFMFLSFLPLVSICSAYPVRGVKDGVRLAALYIYSC